MAAIRHCAYCLRALEAPQDIKTCGKCKRRAYCSKDCQLLDWKMGKGGQGHKNWCGIEYGEEDLDWVVQPVAGKGLGLVAKRDLPRGFRILVDGALTSETQHVGLQDLEPRGGSLREKWKLNALDCGDAGPSSVVCLRLSRANHACHNNADHWFDQTHAVKVLLATRDIKAGDEICINYAAFNDPATSLTAQAARTILSIKWGIVCGSDCYCRNAQVARRIAKMRELDREIASLITSNPVLALTKAKKLLSMLEEDQAPAMSLRRTLYDAFQVAVLKRKTLPEARDFARRTSEVVAQSLHPNNADVAHYAQLHRQPSSHMKYLLLDR